MSDRHGEGQAIEKYLRTYGLKPYRPLVASCCSGVDLVVVIPALAEKAFLFKTLASLSSNPPSELARTLVIIVVNNHRRPVSSARQIQNNRDTIQCLDWMVKAEKGDESLNIFLPQRECLSSMVHKGLRTAYIDASTPGMEIPDRDGGVGTARKIGMDAALEVLSKSGTFGVMSCLDADTCVESNYLYSVRNHFHDQEGDPGAVVHYAHRIPQNPKLAEAICAYELFLRYYALGLSFARSPFAFHTMGSTMACTAKGYRAVRGMNRRSAAEDFHFLNKLAKIGHIRLVTGTTVFPSGRPSARVPFGTGYRVRCHLHNQIDPYQFYAPDSFRILKEWLSLIAAQPEGETAFLMAEAHHIHPELAHYLHKERFDEIWPRVCLSAPSARQRRQQFNVWFDGLKTLKLIHHLARTSHPSLKMLAAFQGLCAEMDLRFPEISLSERGPSLVSLRQVLDFIRAKS